MSIQTTTEKILSDLDAVCAEQHLDGRAVGLAVWSLRLGESPQAPFDEPGPALDALLRFMWLLLVRFPAQERTGFVTSLMRLEMLMAGLEPLEQVTADLLESSKFSEDLVRDERLPASWSHSANALRDVLRRSGDALLLLTLRPVRELRPGEDAPRVAALEVRVDARLRRYLDTGDPAFTLPPEPGRDRADYGQHLAWWGALDEALDTFDQAVEEGLPAWLGARLRASTLVRAGEHAHAVLAYQEVLALRPSADAACTLAQCLSTLGRNEEADAAYGRAAELDPSWATPLWNRGKLRLERLGDIDGARADTVAAIALDPQNADLRLNLAAVHIEAGDDAQAVVSLGEALRLAPGDPRLLLERARARRRLGDLEAALSDIRRVLAEEDSALARIVEGRVLRDLGRLKEASRCFDQALDGQRVAPSVLADAAAVDAALGLRMKAIGRYRAALREAGRGDPVIAQAEAALEALGYEGPRTWPLQELSDHEAMAQARAADPETAAALDAVNDAASALQQQGRLQEAGQLLRDWLARRDAPEAWAALAIVHANLGETEAALHATERAIALVPERTHARTLRARLLSGLGRYEQAAEAWTEVAELRPEVAEVWHFRGAALEGAGRLEEALADYERALSLDPGSLDSHYNRAVVLGDLGRSDEAGTQYDRLLQIAPDDVEGRLNRSVFRFASGDLDGARQDLDTLVARHPTSGRARAKRGAMRLAVGDCWGALFDGLVGLELLGADAGPRVHAAQLVRTGLAAVDVSEDGPPRRTELLEAAQTLVDGLSHDVAEESLGAFFADLEPLLGQWPDFWAVRASIGLTLGLPEDICDSWRDRALRIDPGHPYARYLEAEALLCGPSGPEPMQRAKAALEGALKESDAETDADWRLVAHLRLGRLYLDLDRLDEAARVLEMGLDLDEPAEEVERTNAHIAFLLGYVRSMQGDAAAALSAYTLGIALDPGKPNLWLNRACEHARLCADDPSHKEQALADLAQAMERDREAAQQALEDAYFRPLRDDPAFRSLVALRPRS